jgi:hypothetical protein
VRTFKVSRKLRCAGERAGAGVIGRRGSAAEAGRKSPEVLGAYQTTRVDTSLEEVGGGIGGGGG